MLVARPWLVLGLKLGLPVRQQSLLTSTHHCLYCRLFSNSQILNNSSFVSFDKTSKGGLSSTRPFLPYPSQQHQHVLLSSFGSQTSWSGNWSALVHSRLYGTNIPNITDESAKKESDDDKSEKALSIFQRFKKAYKQHGKVLVGVHIATSAVWLGSFYYLTLSGFEIVPLLEKMGVSETVINPFKKSGLGNVASAYLMYKVATPARYTVTLGGTNLVIRYFRKTGRMDPVPERDKFRQLYRDSKKYLNTRRTQMKKKQLAKMKKRLLKFKRTKKKRF